jgi:hypothetical protein
MSKKARVKRIRRTVDERHAPQYATWARVDADGNVLETESNLPLPPKKRGVKVYAGISPNDWD